MKMLRFAKRFFAPKVNSVVQYLYDRRHGVDTRRNVDVPTSTVRFRRIMHSLPVQHERFTFIDLGCAKGRAMLLASEYPFRRIVGVEYVPELAAAASRNCQIYRSRRQKCRDLTVICQDAAEYQIPPGPVVIYMFNPFPEQVMRLVLLEIENALEREPREIFVAYNNPRLKQLLKDSNCLHLFNEGEHFCIFAGAGLSAQRRRVGEVVRSNCEDARS